MRAGGYLSPKKLKGITAKRSRVHAVKEEFDEEIINIDLSVSQVIDIYGQRCAACPRAQPCPPIAGQSLTVVRRSSCAQVLRPGDYG